MGSNAGNTLTQTYNIGLQLELGSRYFDIRPVICNADELRTGHYSGMQTIASWHGRLGGNGDLISQIVTYINTFHQNHVTELVILDLSHAYNTNHEYRDFNADEWNRVFSELDKLSGKITTDILGSFQKINDITFGSIINRGNVIVRVSDNLPAGTNIPKFVFNETNFPLLNSYSDTENTSQMITDQINKMNKNNNAEKMFLLSWTLTQSGCSVIFDDIRSAANDVNQLLGNYLLPSVTAQHFPNIVYIDNIVDDYPAVIACNSNIKRLAPNAANLSAVDRLSSCYEQTETNDTAVPLYVNQIWLFLASNLAEARTLCPSGWVLVEEAVCDKDSKNVYVCYWRTNDKSSAARNIDGTNNIDIHNNTEPITDVRISKDGSCPEGWEKLANVRAFLPKHEDDCTIIIKR
jgi:hypothetical protein